MKLYIYWIIKLYTLIHKVQVHIHINIIWYKIQRTRLLQLWILCLGGALNWTVKSRLKSFLPGPVADSHVLCEDGICLYLHNASWPWPLSIFTSVSFPDITSQPSHSQPIVGQLHENHIYLIWYYCSTPWPTTVIERAEQRLMEGHWACIGCFPPIQVATSQAF